MICGCVGCVRADPFEFESRRDSGDPVITQETYGTFAGIVEPWDQPTWSDAQAISMHSIQQDLITLKSAPQ